MRILFTCGGESTYIRNAVTLQILKQSHDVIEITDPSRRMAVRHAKLALRLLTCRQSYDLAFVGFLGHFLMLLAPFLARRPILFDMHISVYDTFCLDRRWFAPNSIMGRLTFWLDTTASRRATHILIDTDTHAEYISKTFEIPRDKMTQLFVGCNEQVFYPRRGAEKRC